MTVLAKISARQLLLLDLQLDLVQNWGASAAIDNPSDTTYSTAGAVKRAYDLAAAALSRGGGQIDGALSVNGTFRKFGTGDLIIADQYGVPNRELQIYNMSGNAVFRSDLNADSDGLGTFYFAGASTTIENRLAVQGNRYPAITISNAYLPATMRFKFLESADDGSLQIITRGTDGVNRGIITIPAQQTGEIYHTGRPPTPAEVGAAPAGFGLGTSSVPTRLSLNVPRPNGWQEYNGEAGDVGGPTMYGTVLHMGSVANAGAFAGWAGQLFLGTDGELYTRVNKAANSFAGTSWKTLLHNGANYINNPDRNGVGFGSAGVSGKPWIAAYFGDWAGTGGRVVAGSLSGGGSAFASIGGHSPALDAWAKLAINPGADGNATTYVGMYPDQAYGSGNLFVGNDIESNYMRIRSAIPNDNRYVVNKGYVDGKFAPIAHRETWADKGIHTQTAKGIAWAYYGNGHQIVDASAGNLEGVTVPTTDAQVAWDAVRGATLVGWNGGQTFGVRVDRARLADQASKATDLNGTISSSGQDFKIWGKRAIVGLNANAENTLMLNYGNDWGSTVINGPVFTGTLQSDRHVIIYNGAVGYSNAGVEIRTTDGSSAILGFHRSGRGAASIALKGDGELEFNKGDGATRARVIVGEVDSARVSYVNGGWWVANQGLSHNANHFNDAPFQVNFGGIPGDSHAPIVAGIGYTNGYGYTTRVKLGLRTYPGAWGAAELFVGSSENSAENGHPRAVYAFDAYGNFSAPGKINCQGDVTTAAGLIGFSAYINGPQQGSANALTRRDYVDGRVVEPQIFRSRGEPGNLNNAGSNGSYRWAPGAANIPVGNTYGHAFTFSDNGYFGDGSWASQFAHAHGNGLFYRTIVNGSFADWSKFMFDGGSYSLANLTVNTSISLGTSGIWGVNSATILKDHGNGNTTISGGRNSAGGVGDLYIGYNSPGASYYTNNVRLCRPMVSDTNGVPIIGLYGDVYDGGQRVYSPNNKPTPDAIGAAAVGHTQWRLVASGDISIAMANHATGTLRGTVDTGINSAHGFVHDASKYRAVLYTNNITTSNAGACTWGAYGVLRALSRWNGPHTVQLDIYSYGTSMTAGTIYRWEVYEVI